MKIHELSRRTGVNAETIRMYRNKKLLKPKKNPHNGYYEYSCTDLFSLLYIRTLRGANLPLKSICHVYQNNALTDMLEDFDDEICELNRKIQRMKDQLELLELNKLHLVECQDTRCEVTLMEALDTKYDFYTPIDQNDKDLRVWLSRPELCTITLRIQAEVLNKELAPGSIPLQVGMGTYTSVIEKHHLPLLPDMSICPKGTCLSMIVELTSLEEIERDKILPMKEYAKEHDLHFVSDTTAFLIRVYLNGDKLTFVFRLRVRVEKLV